VTSGGYNIRRRLRGEPGGDVGGEDWAGVTRDARGEDRAEVTGRR